MDGGGRRRRAIKEIVVDHRAEKRWLGNARAGGSLLFVYAPTKERANRMVGLLAETWPSPAARPTSIIW
jgi:hypothetical protein